MAATICPRPVTLTFDLEVGVGVACDLGYPCAKFRLPRPFGFRVRADVHDIRQTDGRMTDADHRLMPPPPTGRGHNNRTATRLIVCYGEHPGGGIGYGSWGKCPFPGRSYCVTAVTVYLDLERYATKRIFTAHVNSHWLLFVFAYILIDSIRSHFCPMGCLAI